MESPYYEMTHDIEEEHRSFQSGYIKGYNDAMMKLPSMIVRCKDCKYYDGDGACMKIAMLNDNWFCADGERKKE